MTFCEPYQFMARFKQTRVLKLLGRFLRGSAGVELTRTAPRWNPRDHALLAEQHDENDDEAIQD